MNGGDGIRVVHPLFQEEGDGSIPISPLQLHVGRITMQIALALNHLWHSRLPEFTYPPEKCQAFGAEYGNRYYACSIWSLPLARNLNYTGRYELRRLAIAPDAPKNTGSRMLKIMGRLLVKERPDVKILISYQDTEAHAGTIYKAAGWTPALESAGGEWQRENRSSKRAQSAAPKIRWEYAINRALQEQPESKT